MIEITIKRAGEVQSISIHHDEVVIGRVNEKTEVHVDLSPDDSVSRIHARAWRENGVVRLEDLGSSGGTYVNGLRINEVISLEADTEVGIGEYCLCFSLKDQSASDGKSLKVDLNSLNSSELVQPNIHVQVIAGGETHEMNFSLEEIYVGRSHPEHEIHIDLSSDLKASRVHARIWRTREICWVEDLNSTHGTKVNGEDLDGARVIGAKDVVSIGDSKLLFHCEANQTGNDEDLSEYETNKMSPIGNDTECAFEQMDSYPVYKEDSYRYFLPGKRKKSDLDDVFQSRKSPMGRIRTTHEVSLEKSSQDDEEALSDFLKVLPDLISKVNRTQHDKMIYDWLINSVSKWVPEAERASVYTIDKEAGRVKLMAHRPALKPIISDVLVHRALEERCAFAWQQVKKEECVRRISANAGIYVPLIAMGEELGVICVEDTCAEADFSQYDLRKLVIVGQLIGLALAQYSKLD